KNWNNVSFDEFFFYEMDRCQYRAASMANSQYVRVVNNEQNNKPKRLRGLTYVPYKETLLALMSKKMLFVLFNELNKKGEANLNWFKKACVTIIEKEIKINSGKCTRDRTYYNSIRIKATNLIELIFNKTNSADLEGSFSTCRIEKIDLAKFFALLKTKVSRGVGNSIPDYEGINGFPLYKHEILSVNIKEGTLEIVIPSIFQVNEEMKHRNFLYKMLFRHFAEMVDAITKETGIFVEFVTTIVVYNTLTMERSIIHFNDVKNTFSEMDLIRTMNAYIGNNLSRTIDFSNCEFCESRRFCSIKSRSSSMLAKLQVAELNNPIKEKYMI
ncbi:MAG: hypothetical protein ACRC0V_12400, partial [Fusobacteriaceae bacterium]